MPLLTRRPRLFGAKYNATTSDVNLGSPSYLDDLGSQTIIAVCRETGDHEANFGYVYSKAASDAGGPRLLLGYGASGLTGITCGFDSTGTTALPQRYTPSGVYVRGEHLFIAARWDGTLTATGIRIHLSRNLGQIKEVTYASTTNGTTAVASDAANDVRVGNRVDLTRTFNGDIHYVAVCKGQLSDTQIETVRQHGPFAVNADWRLIFANGVDYSPYNTRPTSITALGLGGASPYPFFKRQSIWVPVSAGSSVAVTGSGGIVVGGTAGLLRKSVPVATGGMVFAGAADIARKTATVGSGGMTFAGAALPARVSSPLVSGGAIFGGSATVSVVGTQTVAVVGSGGMTLGSSAGIASKRSTAATGGVIFGGSAVASSRSSTASAIGSGGMIFAGSAQTSTFVFGSAALRFGRGRGRGVDRGRAKYL